MENLFPIKFRELSVALFTGCLSRAERTEEAGYISMS